MQHLSNVVRNVRTATAAKSAALLALVGGPGLALANSAATTAITTAQTDALTVVGALLAMFVAVWAAFFVIRFFKK